MTTKKRKVTPKKSTIISILNPKRRIGVAFLTFIATSLLCISLFSGYATISMSNENIENVLGLTTQQKKTR